MSTITVASQVVLSPIQWNTLHDIDDVKPIDDADAPCLEEIRQVLKKYNNLGRFGVALLHSHFELADDELMMETTDIAKREHWVRPVKKSLLTEHGVTAQTTIMNFDETGAHIHCGCYASNLGHTHIS